MRNENLKKEFIKVSNEINPVADKTISVVFRNVETMEDELGRDVSEFTSDEIMNFYRSLSTPSVNRLLVINSVLNRYTRFVLSNQSTGDNQNHFKEINSSALMTCINTGIAKSRIITREDLLKEIQYIENPSEQFIVLGIFEGMRGKNYDRMIDLNIDHISNNRFEFMDSNGDMVSLEFSPKLVDYALQSIDEYRSFSYTSDYTIEEGMGFRPDDDRVVKDLKNVRSLDRDVNKFARRIYGKLVRLQKFYGTNVFEAQALKESGRIHYINEKTKNLHVSKEEAAIMFNHDEEGVLRFGRIHDINLYCKKFGEFLEV